MCGIAGWIDWQQDVTQSPNLIKQMTETLSHRGPDASGYWMSNHCALGHRRLAIMDPEHGAQPMIRKRGYDNFIIVYNGELYNADELRKELAQHHTKFFTRCDTEVLLWAYIVWGSECLVKLNGIYAFAIWQEKEQTLFLARDRLGVKPLFYSIQDSRVYFASEPKAILAHPDFEPVIGAEGLAELLAIGPARTPGHGIFTSMYEVKPAHFMRITQDRTITENYWKLKTQSHLEDDHSTSLTIRHLLTDIVQRQLRADAPLCTLLSGGLDSSILSSIASQQLAERSSSRLDTYSIDYANHQHDFQPDSFLPTHDEPWAQQMADYLNTAHQTVTIEVQQLIDALIPAMKARDFPGMADIDSSLYVFCQQIKQQHKVAISGEASDEIFGGYPWFYRMEALKSNTFPWAPKLHKRISLLDNGVKDWIKPQDYVRERYHQAIDEVPHHPEENTEQQRIRTMSYLNITRFMPTLLDRKDRMSMAAGLEVRVPFCDHRLIEYVWNIPWRIKNMNDQEKGILRKAFADRLPAAVLYRKKSPYPKTHNPQYALAMCRWLKEILHDRSSPILPMIQKPLVLKMIDTFHENRDFHWFGQLMTVPQLFASYIQLNEWLKHYKISIR